MNRIWYGCRACGLQVQRYPNTKYCPVCHDRLTRIGATLPPHDALLPIAAEMADQLRGWLAYAAAVGGPPGLITASEDAVRRYVEEVQR